MRPSLDGLRPVAILAVLGFHVAPSVLAGGFAGVDVFFVLSGYLISSVILFNIRSGTFSIREFYLRRVQRLLPNAGLMILVTVTLCIVILPPSNSLRVAQQASGQCSIFRTYNRANGRRILGRFGALRASAPPGRSRSIASKPFLVWIWVFSYTLYLWHFPRSCGARACR
jgi:peptidoglycan/LPS O-acetylase OafA/YrhL